MKIAEALESYLSDLREEKIPGKRPMYNIHFVNSDGEADETQFTCECEETAKKELEDFFEEFCRENGFDSDSVIDIELLYDDYEEEDA